MERGQASRVVGAHRNRRLTVKTKLAAVGLAGAMILSVVGSSFAQSTGGGSAGQGSGTTSSGAKSDSSNGGGMGAGNASGNSGAGQTGR
jgi:hypothetical protein